MQAFTTLTGVAAPLLRDNIDTDIIIRVERLAGTSRESMGAVAFEAWRFRPDGSENPDFVLNQARYRGAPILLAGANFGCGSSREGAVWAMMGMGLPLRHRREFWGYIFQQLLSERLVAGAASGRDGRAFGAGGR